MPCLLNLQDVAIAQSGPLRALLPSAGSLPCRLHLARVRLDQVNPKTLNLKPWQALVCRFAVEAEPYVETVSRHSSALGSCAALSNIVVEQSPVAQRCRSESRTEHGRRCHVSTVHPRRGLRTKRFKTLVFRALTSRKHEVSKAMCGWPQRGPASSTLSSCRSLKITHASKGAFGVQLQQKH